MPQVQMRTVRLVTVASVIELALGLGMYAFPGHFHAPVYAPLRPYFSYFSTLLLLGGVILADPGRRRAHSLLGPAGVAVAALPLLLLTFLMARAAVWTEAVLYGVLALAVLAEPWLAPRPPAAPEATPLERLVGHLERWPPYLAVAIAFLTALAGRQTVAFPVVVSMSTVLLTGYSVTVRHILPLRGTLEQKALVHLVAVTVVFGLLFGGIGPLGDSLDALLVVMPLVAARHLGARAARLILGLVVSLVVLGKVAQIVLAWQSPTWALGAGLVVTGAVATAALLAMATASEQRLRIAQLTLQEEIVRATRSSLDPDQTLVTASEQLRQAFGASQCIIDPGGQADIPEGALTLPLQADGETTGRIALIDANPARSWTVCEKEFLASVAEHIAVAVHHARIHAALSLRHAELQAANEELGAQQEELTAQNDLLLHNRDLLEAQRSQLKVALSAVIAGESALRASASSRQEAEQELQLFFDTALEMLCLVGFDGCFRKVNTTWSQTLGWEPAELIGQRSVDFVHPDDLEATLDMGALLRAGRDVARFENRYRCKDGSYRWIAWSVAAVPDRQLLVCAARDVTDRRQFEDMLRLAKEEAELANRAKGEFLANMSHEIRTPLNAVLGFSELLTATVTDSRQRSYLESICTAGQSLLSLIGDILDLSKAEAGLMVLHPSPVSLPLLFREIELIFRPQVQEKGLHWSVRIDESAPSALLLDEQRLRQVLLNLVGNAVKFTERGFVQVSARTSAAASGEPGLADLVISVTDSGVGIPLPEQAQIFKAFRQQSGHADRRHGGTGLGLTISRRLVELMDGSLTVQSAPGEGSCFTVALGGVQIIPAHPDAEPAAEADAETAAVSFEPARVLVADDVASNRQLLRAMLQQAGLQVIEAADGLAAVQEAESERPDLILLDIRMPVMDGAQAARCIRRNPALAGTPVIALTAATPERSQAGNESPFDGMMAKPFTRRSLVQVLSRHLALKPSGRWPMRPFRSCAS